MDHTIPVEEEPLRTISLLGSQDDKTSPTVARNHANPRNRKNMPGFSLCQLSRHSLCGTGVTAYLENGSKLEVAYRRAR